MDGHELNFKKWGLSVKLLMLYLQKSAQKGPHDEIFYETLLHNYTKAFFHMGKDISTELTKTNKTLVSCSL